MIHALYLGFGRPPEADGPHPRLYPAATSQLGGPIRGLSGPCARGRIRPLPRWLGIRSVRPGGVCRAEASQGRQLEVACSTMRTVAGESRGRKASSIIARDFARLRAPVPEPIKGKATERKPRSSTMAMAERTERWME